MSDLSPLRRKIGETRPETAPQLLTPERVWRRSVSHGLVRAISLESAVEEVEHAVAQPEDLRASIEDGALVALLDGPAGYGLAIMSRGGLAAMLEVQTMGRVLSRPLGERPVTALDASMVADPLDRILAVQETLVAEMGQKTMVSGYRFAMRIENLREIALSLDDAPHDHFTVRFRAGPGGPREARLDIVLPRLVVAATGGGRSAAWSQGIHQRLMGAEVTLRAELARVSMSVSAVQDLSVGATIPLSRSAMGEVALVAPGDHTMCKGRLGQSGGFKAVRIGAAPRDFEVAEPSAARPDGLPPPDNDV